MVAPARPLDRLFNSLADCLNRESAERLLRLELDPETRAYIEALASKANEGQLSETERADYHAYVEALDLIAILRAKARQILTDSATP